MEFPNTNGREIQSSTCGINEWNALNFKILLNCIIAHLSIENVVRLKSLKF